MPTAEPVVASLWHMVCDSPVGLSHLALWLAYPMHYRFFTFWPWGQSSPNGEMTCYLPRSIVLPNFITLHQPTLEISVTKNLRTNTEQVRQLTRLAYIHTCRSPITAKHKKFTTPAVTVGQVCHTGLTSVERVIDFSIFDLGGLPLGQRSPKGEMAYCPPKSALLQNFSPIAPTMFEICVTKVIQSLALIFDPSRSSKVKFDGANGKPVGPTIKCSRGSNLVSVTVFVIFWVKILTVDVLTLVGLTPRPKVTKRGDDLLST